MINLETSWCAGEGQEGDKKALEFVGANTANYITTNSIGAVVLLDTSARNLRLPVQAALKDWQPNKKVDFYFINPAGLADKNAYNRMEASDFDFDDYSRDVTKKVGPDVNLVDYAINEHGARWLLTAVTRENVLDALAEEDAPRDTADIKNQLIDAHARRLKTGLFTDADNVLLLDQCAHNGIVMRGVKDMLQETFPDKTFHTGVVDHDPDENSSFKPDFVALPKEVYAPLGCRYFGNIMGGTRVGSLQTEMRNAHSDYVTPMRRNILKLCVELRKDNVWRDYVD